VLGMPVITVETSQGKRRFVLDTGSNISTMDIKTRERTRPQRRGQAIQGAV
jgi:hypothetical protein